MTDTNDVAIAEYEYDGLHRRIAKYLPARQANADSVHFYYAGWQVVEMREGSLDGQAVDTIEADATAQYVYHPHYIDAVAVRWYDDTGDGDFGEENEVQCYLHDANFNVTALLDDSANVLERYHYDSYGKVQVLNGGSEDADDDEWTADPDGKSDYANPYLYTGRRLDEETGLYYSRARFYHAQLGRFINRDPIGYAGGSNLYEYVYSSPARFVDPFGLGPLLWGYGSHANYPPDPFAPTGLADVGKYDRHQFTGDGGFNSVKVEFLQMMEFPFWGPMRLIDPLTNYLRATIRQRSPWEFEGRYSKQSFLGRNTMKVLDDCCYATDKYLSYSFDLYRQSEYELVLFQSFTSKVESGLTTADKTALAAAAGTAIISALYPPAKIAGRIMGGGAVLGGGGSAIYSAYQNAVNPRLVSASSQVSSKLKIWHRTSNRNLS